MPKPQQVTPEQTILKTWWQINLIPIKDDAQQVHQLILTTTDISHFKQTEFNLQTSVQDTREIIDHVQDAVFIHDLDGNILDVNETVLKLYRITREEALRYTIREDYAVPESPVHLLPDLWSRALRGQKVRIDWPSQRPSDGTRITWVPNVSERLCFHSKISLD